MAMARLVEEAELAGDMRKRIRQPSSTNSPRRLAPGRSNAAAPSASSTSPAMQASMNQREREGEMVSGR
jgi:hypothetical protein